MIIFTTSLWVLRLLLQPFSRSMGDRVTVTCQHVQVSAKRSVTLMFSFSSGLGSVWCYIYRFPCHITLTSPALPAAAWQWALSSQRDSRHTKSYGFSDSDCSGKGWHLSVNLRAEAGTGEAEVTGSGSEPKTMTPSSVWSIFNFCACWEDVWIWYMLDIVRITCLSLIPCKKFDLKDEINNFLYQWARQISKNSGM